VEEGARSRAAVGVIARAPSAPGKTRLAAHFSVGRLRALRTALAADTLAIAGAVPGVDRFIFFTPDEADAEIAGLAGPSFTRLPQRGDDLGQRMHCAFEDLLTERRYESAVLVGSDLPLLTTEHFSSAFGSLRADADVIIGPADDGGYYLIGMRRSHPELFESIAWGTATVLADTMRAATRAGLTVNLVRRSYDVDTIEDIQRLERDLAAAPRDRAMSVRRWLDSR